MMRKLLFGLAGLLIVLVLVATQLLRPSELLGFQATSHFDEAFIVMIVGMLLIIFVIIAPNGIVGLVQNLLRRGRK